MYLPMSQFLEAPCNSKTQTTMSKTHSLPNITFFACNKVVVTNASIAYTFIYGYKNFDRVFFCYVELILQYVLCSMMKVHLLDATINSDRDLAPISKKKFTRFNNYLQK